MKAFQSTRNRWILFAVCVIIGLASYLWLQAFLARQSKVTFAFALMYDLGSYAAVNDGMLPRTWSDFEVWCDTGNHRHWKAHDLDRQFRLEWGAKLSRLNKRLWITAVDPVYAPYQESLNETLWRIGSAQLQNEDRKSGDR